MLIEGEFDAIIVMGSDILLEIVLVIVEDRKGTDVIIVEIMDILLENVDRVKSKEKEMENVINVEKLDILLVIVLMNKVKEVKKE